MWAVGVPDLRRLWDHAFPSNETGGNIRPLLVRIAIVNRVRIFSCSRTLLTSGHPYKTPALFFLLHWKFRVGTDQSIITGSTFLIAGRGGKTAFPNFFHRA